MGVPDDEETSRILLEDPNVETQVETKTRSFSVRAKEHVKSHKLFWAMIAGMGFVMMACTAIIIVFVAPTSPRGSVIFMVSDGFGPASQTAARNYAQFVNNYSTDYQLPLDTILVGSSRTRSSDSFVTDSAAGATAFSCSLKSYNGAIAVDSSEVPCGTVLEAAKARGYLTGIVTTSRVTHATPASFSAHVPDRDMEDEIAVQQVTAPGPLGSRSLDLLFGGGRRHFDASMRADGVDVIKQAEENGFRFVQTPGEVVDTVLELPVLGIFTNSDMSYEIDREASSEPSLLDMAKTALASLTSASGGRPFFLLIEGARIDHAAHSNDPAAHIHEILMYNQVIDHVKAYVRDHPSTVLVSTSDHETGGLSVAIDPDYSWQPAVITGVKSSAEAGAVELAGLEATIPDDEELKTVISATVLSLFGIADPTSTELNQLVSLLRAGDAYSVTNTLGGMVSDRAELGWSTTGHSAVDVNLYAFAGGDQESIEALRGNHENTEVGQFLSDYLGTNLVEITEKLKEFDMPARPKGRKEVIRGHHH